ncbi:hypothetical protein OPV22_018672 [Ensete ventricosum]|uniref:TF-B3 domain-containing protein n=1 Tax=Ensete ventricosum TaxID=4639 RepID=A0AAV8R0U6_ENSVE|nr:hypothetical protein OPV22_018672 [Ensete ventricosum]
MEARCRECRKREQHYYWNHFEATKKRFFKVLIADFSRELSIPRKFVLQFRDLSEDAKLKGPSGNLWSVRLKRSGDDVIFTGGWSKFAEDHRSELGDFLVFRYIGDSCFKVDLEWIIDTCASYHATPRREFFATYRSENFGVVKMGNYDTTNIIGMRDIHIKTNIGCKLVLKDVRHVIDLRLNLISVVKLDDEDFDVRFHKGQWKLSKGSLIVANGKKCHTLYRLQAKACVEQLNATEKDFSIELWHRRLRHMSKKGL